MTIKKIGICLFRNVSIIMIMTSLIRKFEMETFKMQLRKIEINVFRNISMILLNKNFSNEKNLYNNEQVS